jgi:ferrochelatase
MPQASTPLGVILSNMGSPSAPTPAAVRAYLREFLSDPDIVDLPRLLWLPLLHGIVLRTRPRRAARLYASIWTDDAPPLTTVTRRQAAALQAALRARLGHEVFVEPGMRYGSPSLSASFRNLLDRHCAHIILFPLYPQYSIATTGSTVKAAGPLALEHPEVRLEFARNYHAHTGYIAALAASVREFQAAHGRPDRLLLSFHGMPASSAAKGDPYAEQCRTTASLLAHALGLQPADYGLAFQSRFGPAEWLRPYTDAVLKNWAREGVATVHAVCPGFAADCLETLEEVAVRYRTLFLNHGGKEFRYVPALNDRPDHIAFLASQVEASLA